MRFNLLIFFCILGISNAILDHACESSETSDLWIDNNGVNQYPNFSGDFIQNTWNINGECIGVVPNTFPHTCTVGYSLVNEGEASPCWGCLEGEYQDEIGYSGYACKVCPTGYYSPRDSAPECTACPAGYKSYHQWTNSGTRFHQCNPCPKGKFSYEGSVCQNCPDGFFSKNICFKKFCFSSW